MKRRPIKFRFFCPPAKGFVENYNYNGPVDELFDDEDKTLIPSQYIEVNDVDGNKIYEGDLLEITLRQWVNKKYTGIVEYMNGGFGCKLYNPEGTLSVIWFHQINFYDGVVKIFGNKFENPELIS